MSMTEIKKLNFKKFDDIKAYTKTFIVGSNIELNIKTIFENLKITKYNIETKKRGRKKSNVSNNSNINDHLVDGDIITINFEKNIKGVLRKKKTNKNYFRNSMTIVIWIDGKFINTKISKNGKFQLTGCRCTQQARKTIQFIWKLIKIIPNSYTFTNFFENIKSIHIKKNIFTSIFVPAMRNIEFSLGFQIDREKLDEYFNNNTKYYSLLETSFGYTGVNIKIPLSIDEVLKIDIEVLQEITHNNFSSKFIKYKEYLNLLSDKDKQKRLNKKIFNTFLCFYSGSVIMSHMIKDTGRSAYKEFCKIIEECYDHIVEKLDV